MFDPITAALEDSYAQLGSDIRALSKDHFHRVHQPLLAVPGSKPTPAAAQKLVHSCLATAEEEFAAIAGEAGIDTWLSLLRRFPSELHTSGDWLTYVTRALVKHSAQMDSTAGRADRPGQFGLVIPFSHELFLNAVSLSILASYMASLAGKARWIGKGARLRPNADDPTRLEIPASVETAVAAYERRRPKNRMFADEGFLVPSHSDEASFHMTFLVRNTTKWVYVPSRNISLYCQYLPMAIPGSAVRSLLLAYEEAVQEAIGISVDGLCSVLAALTELVDHSIPRIDGATDRGLVLQPDDGSPEYDQRLGFLFALCQKGYLRFPGNHWKRSLGAVQTPWTQAGQTTGEVYAEQFLASCLITQNEARSIDLSTLRPVPWLHQSPSGEVYFDLTATGDALAELLDKAKEWYASQHGDRFTLSLKRYIEAQTNSVILAGRQIYTVGAERCEVDLLVRAGKCLYVVECKAYAKSRAYFRGHRSAVMSRKGRVRQAVRQAEKAARFVAGHLDRVAPGLPEDIAIEWVVCTPTQEYLTPLDEFGLLDEGIPRVCTPEEFVAVLNQK